MVLEQIIKTSWIENKSHSFVLAYIYTLVAIFCSVLILPSYSGMLSVAFASVLLLPSLNKLLNLEENIERKEKIYSLKIIFKDHFDIIKTYFFLFFGIFFAYFTIALVLTSSWSARWFMEQYTLTGLIGSATANATFWQLFQNNLLVFAVCILLSFIYGAGSIIFLSINASAWGVFFGTIFHRYLASGSMPQFHIFPHTFTEGLAYVIAAIIGGVISKAVLREKKNSRAFKHIMIDAGIFSLIGIVILIIAGILEATLFV